MRAQQAEIQRFREELGEARSIAADQGENQTSRRLRDDAFFAERARSGRARGAAFPAQATEARRSEEATAVRRTLAFETERVVAVGYSADGSRRRRGRDVDIPW